MEQAKEVAVQQRTNGDGQYTAESIRILRGLEAVRQRPAMYIGDVGERGLHHLIYEVVDNSIDEAMAGYCRNIIVTLHADGSCSVEDDGRGIPTEMHPEEKKSTLEVVMCTLHAGGKFDKSVYKVSGGLHGVGVSCVNALSEEMEVIVKRNGKVFRQRYQRGNPVTPVEEIGKTRQTGTYVRFKPDPEIFPKTEFRYDRVAERLRELAFLNPSLTLWLKDEREGIEEKFQYSGGLKDFVKYHDEGKIRLIEPIYLSGTGTAADGTEVVVEVCFEYTNTDDEKIMSYVNNINTSEGGTHVTGFRTALSQVLNRYATKNGLIKKSKGKGKKKGKAFSLKGEDFRKGLTAIISVKVANPQFEGQTKTKLGNSDVKGIVLSVVNAELADFLEHHRSIAKKIIEKAIAAAELRRKLEEARKAAQRKNALDSLGLPGKLADCSSTDTETTELFLVEGDSAGGSAKQARDRRFQAILPLKGKILNVQKSGLTKVLENEEIMAIFAAIGAGFEEHFDLSKCRYGKIILMADADVDGAHIRTLLLTLFFRYMRELVEAGRVYIAQPPLYRIKKGKQVYYAYSDRERDQILRKLRGFSDNGEEDLLKSAEQKGIVISRFKGLGEMDPDQLWETTMNPETRTLLRVTIENAALASKLFETLMGVQVEPRREFIERNALYVRNLDV